MPKQKTKDILLAELAGQNYRIKDLEEEICILTAPVELPPEPKTLIDFVKFCFTRENIPATIVALIFGGFIPFAVWWLSHKQLNIIELRDGSFNSVIAIPLILGGLAYSATTVVELSTLAFHKRSKAWGFTILLEGVLLGASTTWLSISALLYLILLNAVGTAVSVTRPINKS
jgi:hypothetical protein